MGYSLDHMDIEGQSIGKIFLQPELQAEMGTDGYDKGAAMLTEFFKKELQKFNVPELSPLGKTIVGLCLSDAPLEDYLAVIPMR